ncbi:MAG TPA: mechanosensitive ion channel domain-containing protein [Blastocatellia bacterium]|nr:mechanosensitive ion channel domain-containing protein [Blastocatellia bacterium]
MLFQEITVESPPPPEIRDTIFQKIIQILNYPFVNQKEFKVSVLSLLLLVFVIFISVMISRYLRRFLEKRVLVNFHVPTSLQYTLLRIVHYIIVTIGLIYGLKLGLAIDLTSLAVILGFLSVGIGFGLQYIASDIVSGFILLFERPVRIGDRLRMDDIEGRVDNISIRTTTVVTNDDITVILPNSDLVRGRVTNWSYSNKVRIRVPVGAAYGSDVEVVTRALCEAGGAVSSVLKDPPPKVQLKNFGESSLDFELLVWINRPHDHTQIRSDLNYEIERLFRQYDIEIPFPQRDVHLRSGSLKVTQKELEVEDEG